MHRVSVGLLILMAAACNGLNDDAGRTTARSCAELQQVYETQLAAVCSVDSGGYASRSGYCATCVRARLFSYRRNDEGTCVCRPLLLNGERCAGSAQSHEILAAIVAADDECQHFSTDQADGGVTGDADASD